MPLFVSDRDRNLFDHFNKELINTIIDTVIDIYRMSAVDTEENLYGESSEKTYYFPAVRCGCLISHDSPEWDNDEMGTDVNQTVTFAFHRNTLVDIDVYPEMGDIFGWNGAYYEVDGIVENQLIAGRTAYNHSVVYNTHMTRRSGINLENIRVGDTT